MKTLLAGGTILTADIRRPDALAVLIEDGRIAALDEDAHRQGVGAERFDLSGRTLVPGFHDCHCHPVLGGVQMNRAPIWGVGSLPELLERVSTYAESHPDLAWIRGFGYLPSILPNARGDAAVLDSVVPDRPVFLYANDGHTGWANTVALRLAGITRETPDPAYGEIVRRADGSPSGALLESATEILEAAAPPPTHRDRVEGGRAALELFRANGVTWVQDALSTTEDVAAFLELATDALLPRSSVALRAEPDRWRDQFEPFRAAREQARSISADLGGRTEVETVKFFADGVIETGTAALLDEYSDRPGSHGIPNWSQGSLAEAVAAFDGAGFRIHIHAIGDAGIRDALDAVEFAATRNGQRDRRATIAHTQLVHPSDLPRFASLGVIANFEPLWAQLEPTMVTLTLPRLGPIRSDWQYPIGSLVRAGARVSFGSDWPVSSLNPLEGMAVAMARQTRAGEPPGGWLSDQRVDLETALYLYTAAGAYQRFAEDRVGKIAVGMEADLVLLAADLKAIEPLALAEVAVEAVWLSGERAL
jgi:predicted amidohydrolase YtcJ